MKRAKAHEMVTGFFQLNAFRNHVYNIRRIPDRLNNIFRDKKGQNLISTPFSQTTKGDGVIADSPMTEKAE